MFGKDAIDAETLYMRIGHLIETMPDLANAPLNADTYKWLGDAYALTKASGDIMASIELKSARDIYTLNLGQGGGSIPKVQNSISKIHSILYQILAVVELKTPAASQGSFIPAGSFFDAMAVISKVLNRAKSDVLIVDPYLDEKVLTKYAGTIKENVSIRLLADEKKAHTALQSAYQCWVTQYENKRPLALRFAPRRELHDRLIIIDGAESWVATQSFNTFAEKSPACLVRFPAPAVRVKIEAYQDIWQCASSL